MNDLLLTASLWTLFLFSLIPLTLKLFKKNKECSPFLTSGLVLLGILTSLIFLIINWPENGETIKIFSSALVLNHTRALATLFLLCVSGFTTLMSIRHPQVPSQYFSEILFLKIGSLIGLKILLLAGNLLTAFLGLELASLAFYLLIALGRTGDEALKAGFKYFVLGSLASVILLYGISFIFGSVGHFDLKQVFETSPELLKSSRLFVLGLVFLFVGFLFKMAIFPFHFWLPEVYRGSFTPLLVFMATGFKLVLFVLLFDITKNIFTFLPGLLVIFQCLALLSVLFGNILALLQKDLKKILLFSTIAHSGYLFMILISTQINFSMGKMALLYYLMVYICMMIGIFICLRPFEKSDEAGLSLDELKSLAHKHPVHAGLLSLFLLSLAGLPPSGGFIAKLFLFQSLLESGFWWMLFWTIIGSSIALFYYLRPIALMYMEDSSKEEKTFSFPGFLIPAIGFLIGMTLLTGLAPFLFNFF